MLLVSQWQQLVDRLPAGWAVAQVRLRLAAAASGDRVATLIRPLQAHRADDGTFAFRVASDGSGPAAAMATRLFDLVDREGLAGRLELASTAAAQEPAAPQEAKPTLAESWAAALATLPADWSDLLGEIELDSSDYVERAALDLSPINPRRDHERLALRFRSARKAGYGASPAMVARCLERCAADGIVGRVVVLRVLSDTRPVQTQGPIWQLAGRTV